MFECFHGFLVIGRYYGNASQFGDLFAFVRLHAAVFDQADSLLSEEGWLPPVVTERSATNYQLDENTSKLA